MKIAIISDTHDHLYNLREAVKIIKEEGVSTIIHLGDIISPFVVKEFGVNKVYAVFGNNDGDKDLLRERFEAEGYEIQRGPRELLIDNRRFLLMHEPHLIDGFIKSGLWDIILFGHTHKLSIEEGIPLVINPGELCGYLTGKSTFVLLETSDLNYKIVESKNYT